MIMQVDSQFIQDCPVCGRPLRIGTRYRGHRVSCHHCRGQFVAGREQAVGFGIEERVDRALHRADRLLYHGGDRREPDERISKSRCREKKDSSCREIPSAERRSKKSNQAEKVRHQAEPKQPSQMPTVLVVEYRDEVYRRLEVDLGCAGFRVTRAYCASEGIVQYFMFRPDLVIANVDLPDQSGWLLTAKLCVTDPLPHVWLYKSEATRADAAKAGFLGAEELLAYRSIQDLSCAVFASLAGDTTSLAVAANTHCRS